MTSWLIHEGERSDTRLTVVHFAPMMRHCFLFSLQVLGGAIRVSMSVEIMFQGVSDSMVVESTSAGMNCNQNAITM